MESEVQVIKSTTVARRVVDSLGLSTLAEFNPALAPSEDNIADDIKTAIKGLFKPVIAWLREGTVERRGIELAQAQSPGAWDLPPDEMRRGAGETRVISRFLKNLAVEIEGSSRVIRSEEHTSELQSLMRTSYAVFCLNKK